jgi:YkoY family integral membrane protein
VFGQTFDLHDLIIIAVLVVLEGVLSIDNALVLGLLARRLPKSLQKKALTYGLVGAFVFRLVAVGTAAWLLHWRWVKLIGGLYLLWVAVRHFAFGEEAPEDEKLAVDDAGNPIIVDEQTGKPVTQEQLEERLLGETHGRGSGWVDYAHAHSTHTRAFWLAVGAIEMTDIAFAVDSIVAAIGVVGPPPEGQRHPKLWVVLAGGMLGVILMRFAAVAFIKLLERFPKFETSAYLLVLVIGAKLTADYVFNTPQHPDRVNLHSPSSAWFWVFWGLMLAAFCFGFLPHEKPARASKGAGVE